MAHVHRTYSTSCLAPAWSTKLHEAVINILPDDIFLEIFAFCLVYGPYNQSIQELQRMVVWQGLVQVCQRWRQLIYASSRYLDLLLFCFSAKDLSCWPEFPIAISCFHPVREDDVIAVLKHSDRVRLISLTLTNLQLGKVVTAMHRSHFRC